MLYELLCGRRPFTADSSTELLKQVIERPVISPRSIRDDIPKPLEAICLKALAKNPADRYLTASDMAADLPALLAAVPIKAANRALIAAAVLGVLMLLVATGWGMHQASLERRAAARSGDCGGPGRAIGRT